MTNAIGIDLSIYEGVTDPDTEIKAGGSFMITKAIQGYDKDFMYGPNMKQYKGKIPRGHYMLLDPRFPPKPQADLYIKTIQADPGEIPILWVDFEKPVKDMSNRDYFKCKYSGWHALYDTIEQLKKYIGGVLPIGWQVGLYTNWGMWDLAGPKTDPENEYFTKLPLWVASYAPAPVFPRGFNAFIFWQFTAWGNGVFTVGDLNYYNGTADMLNKWIGSISPKPPPVDPGPTKPPIITGGNLLLKILTPVNIRATPDITAAVVGIRKARDPFTIDAITVNNGMLWGHDSAGWSALGSPGNQLYVTIPAVV